MKDKIMNNSNKLSLKKINKISKDAEKLKILYQNDTHALIYSQQKTLFNNI